VCVIEECREKRRADVMTVCGEKVDIAGEFGILRSMAYLTQNLKLDPNEACCDIKKIILQSTYSLLENISTLSTRFKNKQNLNVFNP
jgi:hypothetical protein